MIIVNQKNWKMIKNKGENGKHWTKKKASLELCEQVRELKNEKCFWDFLIFTISNLLYSDWNMEAVWESLTGAKERVIEEYHVIKCKDQQRDALEDLHWNGPLTLCTVFCLNK